MEILAVKTPEFDAYMIYLKQGSSRIGLKFDTGSVFTVIGMDNLVSDLNLDKSVLSNILEKAEGNKYFRSASGNTMDAAPCVIHNIYIRDVFFENFYFYLSSGDVFLLGDNFINCCEFTKKKNSDIIKITDFDFNAYTKRAIDEFGSHSTFYDLSSIDYSNPERDVAATFREYFK